MKTFGSDFPGETPRFTIRVDMNAGMRETIGEDGYVAGTSGVQRGHPLLCYFKGSNLLCDSKIAIGAPSNATAAPLAPCRDMDAINTTWSLKKWGRNISQLVGVPVWTHPTLGEATFWLQSRTQQGNTTTRFWAIFGNLTNVSTTYDHVGPSPSDVVEISWRWVSLVGEAPSYEEYDCWFKDCSSGSSGSKSSSKKSGSEAGYGIDIRAVGLGLGGWIFISVCMTGGVIWFH